MLRRRIWCDSRGTSRCNAGPSRPERIRKEGMDWEIVVVTAKENKGRKRSALGSVALSFGGQSLLLVLRNWHTVLHPPVSSSFLVPPTNLLQGHQQWRAAYTAHLPRPVSDQIPLCPTHPLTRISSRTQRQAGIMDRRHQDRGLLKRRKPVCLARNGRRTP